MSRRRTQATIPEPYEDVRSLRTSVAALKELVETLAGQEEVRLMLCQLGGISSTLELPPKVRSPTGLADRVEFNNPVHGRAIAKLAGTHFNPECDVCVCRLKDGCLLGGVMYTDYSGEIYFHAFGSMDVALDQSRHGLHRF